MNSEHGQLPVALCSIFNNRVCNFQNVYFQTFNIKEILDNRKANYVSVCSSWGNIERSSRKNQGTPRKNFQSKSDVLAG